MTIVSLLGQLKLRYLSETDPTRAGPGRLSNCLSLDKIAIIEGGGTTISIHGHSSNREHVKYTNVES
jgi:hypothetical protein